MSEPPLDLYNNLVEDLPDVSSSATAVTYQPWKVLVVDDDEDIHKMTEIVLRSFTFDGRPLELHRAYSGEETKKIMKENPNIAVILLDVVMESDDSGLMVVKYIRNKLKNSTTRIILRTGQPGAAPENDVITEYDINDYKEKSELTKRKLFTAITTAIRSYQHISSIEKNRIELHKIIISGSKIFQLQSMKDFCQAVLQQLSYLLNMDSPAMHLQSRGFAASYQTEDFQILASIGTISDIPEQRKGEKVHIIPLDLIEEIKNVIGSGKSQYRDGWYITLYKCDSGVTNIICVETDMPMDTMALDLIELFNMNVGIAFNNLYLNKEVMDTQTELIYALGEIIETRCRDTSYHVQRVSKFAEYLYRVIGQSAIDTQTFKVASVLHDIGKLAVPDSVLMKSGKLTKEEVDVIKKHPLTGYNLLKFSERPIFQKAAEISLYHHEHWDGSGYPLGLKGKEIPLSARVLSLVDVFDALSMDRIYRKAWELDRVLDYIQKNSGKLFDPKLVSIFIEHIEEFLDIQRDIGVPEINIYEK